MGTFHASLVLESVDWFYNRLGLPASYFDRFKPLEIAKHVSAFTSAKSLNKSQLQITIPHDTGFIAMCSTSNEDVYAVAGFVEALLVIASSHRNSR